MGPAKPPPSSARERVRAANSYPRTTSVHKEASSAERIEPERIRHFLRQLGITEQVVIHEQGYDQFLEEKGLKQLGQGGEATVYFLRGHVVKVARPDSAPALLREIAHMLHLNRFVGAGGAMGERNREDWPALLWVYALSDGSLSIGMKPFDKPSSLVPGATLYEHLEYGPPLEREHTLRIVWGICRSLVYAHQSGIVHHDLKPANIYVPSDPAQQPIIFDLAQALWQQGSWGRNWLTHEHNSTYWYNGTYRYMHYQRRLAHLAAVAKAAGELPTPNQSEAFRRYRPTFYDDVSAVARILHDIVRSMNTWLSTKDRVALRKFYRRLLGLKHNSPAEGEKGGETSIFRRIRLVFGSAPPPAPVAVDHDPPLISMADVLPPLEKVLAELS